MEAAKQSPAAMPPRERQKREAVLNPKCRKYKETTANVVAIG